MMAVAVQGSALFDEARVKIIHDGGRVGDSFASRGKMIDSKTQF